MPAQSANGIILRKYYLRETSYILVVFTREFGKIKGVIKGVRAPYPQFAGNFEIFTECRLLFYRKKKSAMDLITECEAVDFFLPARKEIERLTYANYFIELIDTVTAENDPNEQLYRSLADSLRLLGTDSSPRRVSRIFEIKALNALGISPEWGSCVMCGSPDEKGAKFSVKEGGLLCAACSGKDPSSMTLSLGTLYFMRKILASDMDKASRIKVSSQVGREAEEALGKFIAYHVGRPMRSLAFLEGLKRRGIVRK